MTYLGPWGTGLELTTASVTIDPALASADPAMMATAARAFASAAHQVQGAGQASSKASSQLSMNWWGRGKQGFDAAAAKANSRARVGAEALADASGALVILAVRIAEAKAMAENAQTMATDSTQAAATLRSAYAASSAQALPSNATPEQALAARAPTPDQVAQANSISSQAAHATQLMDQANAMARQAWDQAAAAFEAITARATSVQAATGSALAGARGAHQYENNVGGAFAFAGGIAVGDGPSESVPGSNPGNPVGPVILKTPPGDPGPLILGTPPADHGPEYLINVPGDPGPLILGTPPADHGPERLVYVPADRSALINHNEGGDPQGEPKPNNWPSAGHGDQLPQEGEFPYVPPKGAHGQPQNLGSGQGFLDKYGNRWQWARQEVQHGGPHWDVQLKGGGYVNVTPQGKVL